VVVALLIQPFIGLLHHRRFVSSQKQSFWTFLHLWYGRTLILLGIINGGLGLQLAANTKRGMIAYSVLGGITGASLCALIAFVEVKRIRTKEPAVPEEHKHAESG
jgi:hypothetical protein